MRTRLLIVTIALMVQGLAAQTERILIDHHKAIRLRDGVTRVAGMYCLIVRDRVLFFADATVNIAGRTLHADASGVDMYAAIDLLSDKLDRLLSKHKGKQVDSHRRAESAARNGDFA